MMNPFLGSIRFAMNFCEPPLYNDLGFLFKKGAVDREMVDRELIMMCTFCRYSNDFK